MSKTLTNRKEITVRFSECDPLKVVWHGNYVKYFEDGRESFGEQYGLAYLQIYEQSGFAVPIVSMELNYKKMVGVGEKIVVETTMINTPAAKLIFEYKIFNSKNEVVCTGSTVQVFVDAHKQELMIVVPEFIENWKKKYLPQD